MADTLRVLGQSAPAATTETDLYVVPGATSASVSTITVCNRGATTASFRITVAIAGAATTNAQYLYYDLPIPANETFACTFGVTPAATDVIRVYASTANLTFQAFGVEVA